MSLYTSRLYEPDQGLTAPSKHLLCQCRGPGIKHLRALGGVPRRLVYKGMGGLLRRLHPHNLHPRGPQRTSASGRKRTLLQRL
jgi:hypothetical protein